METHNCRYHECTRICIYIYITQLQCHSKLPAAISPRPSALPFLPWRLNIAESQPDARRRRRQESDACHGCYSCKCHNAGSDTCQQGTPKEFPVGTCHCHAWSTDATAANATTSGSDTCQQGTPWEFLAGMCHCHAWITDARAASAISV